MFRFERGLRPRNRFLGEVSEGAAEALSDETPQMGPYPRGRQSPRAMRRAQLQGGARRRHARRTLCTSSVQPRAPTPQMGPYHRSRAAITAISTRYFGEASLASTVARAGVLAGSTQASHAAFISS